MRAGVALGAATLFFGCRARDQDYIYAAELAEFVRSGALSALHVAFSREGAAKDYVQHHMAREAAALAELLMVRRSREFGSVRPGACGHGVVPKVFRACGF